MLAWALALGLGAWVLADIFWRIAAPGPAVFPVVLSLDAAQAAQTIAARHPMGEGGTAAVSGDAARFSLFGLVTGSDAHPGFAVLAVDGAPPVGVVAGQSVAPGVVLSGIYPDHVELRTSGGVQSLSLPPAGAVSASDFVSPPMVVPIPPQALPPASVQAPEIPPLTPPARGE